MNVRATHAPMTSGDGLVTALTNLAVTSLDEIIKIDQRHAKTKFSEARMLANDRMGKQLSEELYQEKDPEKYEAIYKKALEEAKAYRPNHFHAGADFDLYMNAMQPAWNEGMFSTYVQRVRQNQVEDRARAAALQQDAKRTYEDIAVKNAVKASATVEEAMAFISEIPGGQYEFDRGEARSRVRDHYNMQAAAVKAQREKERGVIYDKMEDRSLTRADVEATALEEDEQDSLWSLYQRRLEEYTSGSKRNYEVEVGMSELYGAYLKDPSAETKQAAMDYFNANGQYLSSAEFTRVKRGLLEESETDRRLSVLGARDTIKRLRDIDLAAYKNMAETKGLDDVIYETGVRQKNLYWMSLQNDFNAWNDEQSRAGSPPTDDEIEAKIRQLTREGQEEVALSAFMRGILMFNPVTGGLWNPLRNTLEGRELSKKRVNRLQEIGVWDQIPVNLRDKAKKQLRTMTVEEFMESAGL